MQMSLKFYTDLVFFYIINEIKFFYGSVKLFL